MSRIRTIALSLTALVTLAAGTAACAADQPVAGGATTGEAVYRQQCATCHGADGQGVGDVPALTDQRLAELGPEGIATIVVDGTGTMTGFGNRLTPAQVDAVAAHLTEGG
jgi:mono/diheme cytochrome c family protein